MKAIDINEKIAIGRRTVALLRNLRDRANGNPHRLSTMIKSAIKTIISSQVENRYRIDWMNDAIGKV